VNQLSLDAKPNPIKPMVADKFEAAFYCIGNCQNDHELKLIIMAIKLQRKDFSSAEMDELTRQVAAKQIELYAVNWERN
jgi:hypothetical protein